MAKDPGNHGDRVEEIRSEELASFAEKLQEWGSNLSPKERALLQIVLDRAQGVEAGDVAGFNLQPDVRTAAISALRSILKRGGVRVSAWVQMGEPWVQSGLKLHSDDRH